MAVGGLTSTIKLNDSGAIGQAERVQDGGQDLAEPARQPHLRRGVRTARTCCGTRTASTTTCSR